MVLVQGWQGPKRHGHGMVEAIAVDDPVIYEASVVPHEELKRQMREKKEQEMADAFARGAWK